MSVELGKKNHLHRRLGHLKANKVPCCVSTLSGCDFEGRIVSFDEISLVIRLKDTADANQLVTVMFQGLESIAGE